MNPLDELPEHESFYNLDMVFEGLTSLRPKVLTALLTSCRKIKVRRLFFVLADRHDHAWRKHLNTGAFDFGTGERRKNPSNLTPSHSGTEHLARRRLIFSPQSATGAGTMLTGGSYQNNRKEISYS